jgi:butyryl-CoA dehydrogenase
MTAVSSDSSRSRQRRSPIAAACLVESTMSEKPWTARSVLGSATVPGTVNFDLTDEQRLVRETARAFTDNEIVERARENDRNEHFDLELVRKIADQGYLGAIVPREYGGAGLDYLTYGLVVEEIGRGDSAMRTVISVQTSLVCSSILRWGTEEQKQYYLPKLCSGEWLGCFGLTEPDTGSDAANQRTRARRTDSGWVINGAKMFISLANHAKVALVFAQTDPEKAHRGLACFLVDADQPGFQPQEIHHKMGLRGSDTASISLDDVEVGDDALLGEVGDGFKVAMSALDSGRYSVAAGCVGICQGCVDASVSYAKQREQFGRPIASFQLVQAMIADMAVETDAARMLVWRAGYLKDTGKPNTTETSIAKLYATEAAVRSANTAIQVHGGSGYVDDHPVERYFRDVRVTTLYEGTSQIQKLIIGRALTGINALVPS